MLTPSSWVNNRISDDIFEHTNRMPFEKTLVHFLKRDFRYAILGKSPGQESIEPDHF